VTHRVRVETGFGTVRGARDGDAFAFLGLPYARAERLRAPVPAPAWTGELDAGAHGPGAPQPDRPVARFTHGPMPAVDEEHCLNLNVFTPSLDGSRPVLVWVHGGGSAVGHAAASLYRGARLAQDADVVVVTINYRLGSLGWLCHPDLGSGDRSAAGNWGLLDVVEALRWVRQAIAAFGGDPSRVTVAGQSAGALIALDLLAVPEASGLLTRVIAQSPVLADLMQPPERALDWAQALSESVTGTPGFSATGLRSAPAGRILEAHESLLETPRFRGTRGAVPTHEPGSLPTCVLDEPSISPQVPLLIGSNADEGTFFFGSPWRPAPPAERIPDVVAHLVSGEDPGEVLERYRKRARRGGGRTDPGGLLAAIATDAMVAEPVRRLALARAGEAHVAPVHLYRVDHPGGGPDLGCTHTTEVPLLFGTWDDGGPGERLGGQAGGAAAVSRALTATWRSFIHGEDPGWAALRGDRGSVGVFGGDQAVAHVPFAAAGDAPEHTQS
jgi:para-nitrobenzyl esterase